MATSLAPSPLSRSTLGLSPSSVEDYLISNAEITKDGCIHKASGRKIKAVLAMHTFGHPVELTKLVQICNRWKIKLVEDCAESLGSFYKGRHTGLFGELGTFSFNGNKIITTGGGGMMICQREDLGSHLKHITTTSKVPHKYEFVHDQPGFNYRMPNINAALGCAQLEKLDNFIFAKRSLASKYEDFFENSQFDFIKEPNHAKSNYWLNAVKCASSEERDELLVKTNAAGVLTRPIWQLMTKLPMFSACISDSLVISEELCATVVNLPSTPIGQ